ncbi:MAG: hypothetical protein ANABAC_2034 [Anaerolineae bacterium]|nr:MAG: hypothetical protein ANABAC_2034 [Anaerolineae bacterium]
MFRKSGIKNLPLYSTFMRISDRFYAINHRIILELQLD